MKCRNLVLGLMAVSLLLSCGSNVQERERVAIARGIYAVDDSNKAGRFDLSTKYSSELIRLVAPPPEKDRIKINLFSTQKFTYPTNSQKPAIPAQNYVVLPPGFNRDDVVVVGSEHYKDLLDKNKTLDDQVKKEKREFGDYKQTTDGILRDKEKELKELRNKPGFFGTIWNFITGFFKWGLFGFLGIGAIVTILCFIFPPMVPIVFGFLRTIRNIFNWVLSFIARIFVKKSP